PDPEFTRLFGDPFTWGDKSVTGESDQLHQDSASSPEADDVNCRITLTYDGEVHVDLWGPAHTRGIGRFEVTPADDGATDALYDLALTRKLPAERLDWWWPTSWYEADVTSGTGPLVFHQSLRVRLSESE